MPGTCSPPRQSTQSILATISKDSLALSRAETHLAKLKGQAARQASEALALGQTTTSGPSPGLQNQIDATTAKITEAQTRLSGRSGRILRHCRRAGEWRHFHHGEPKRPTANSDRKQVAEIAVLLGLLIGGLVGAAAALALGARVPRTS